MLREELVYRLSEVPADEADERRREAEAEAGRREPHPELVEAVRPEDRAAADDLEAARRVGAHHGGGRAVAEEERADDVHGLEIGRLQAERAQLDRKNERGPRAAAREEVAREAEGGCARRATELRERHAADGRRRPETRRQARLERRHHV